MGTQQPPVKEVVVSFDPSIMKDQSPEAVEKAREAYLRKKEAHEANPERNTLITYL